MTQFWNFALASKGKFWNLPLQARADFWNLENPPLQPRANFKNLPLLARAEFAIDIMSDFYQKAKGSPLEFKISVEFVYKIVYKILKIIKISQKSQLTTVWKYFF